MSGAEAARPAATGTAAPGPGDRKAPALGPGIWAVLLRNEWFKTRKRLAFWLTLGFFAFITTMENGEELFDDEPSFFLPEAWSSIFSDQSVLLVIFGCIAVIMLAASEFSWRTARQNVIDGVSKTQWFWGRYMLLPLLGVIFLAVKLGIAGSVAAILTDPAAASGPLVPPAVFEAAGALLLAFLNVGGLALFLALAIRSAGPAMAAWFFWIAFGEQLVPSLLARAFPNLEPVLGYLPFSAAQQVMRFESYDPAAYERMVEAARAAERSVPPLPDLGTVLAVNAGWAILFVAVAFVWFRRRDL